MAELSWPATIEEMAEPLLVLNHTGAPDEEIRINEFRRFRNRFHPVAERAIGKGNSGHAQHSRDHPDRIHHKSFSIHQIAIPSLCRFHRREWNED